MPVVHCLRSFMLLYTRSAERANCSYTHMRVRIRAYVSIAYNKTRNYELLEARAKTCWHCIATGVGCSLRSMRHDWTWVPWAFIAGFCLAAGFLLGSLLVPPTVIRIPATPPHVIITPPAVTP